MSLPTGWRPVPLDPTGGLPQSAALPDPDGDLRLVVVAVAPDLAAVLAAPPELVVCSSAEQLAVRPGPVAPASRDIRLAAAGTALAALTGPPGTTLSAAQVRVVVLVVTGRRVLAASPALPARPLPVLADGRLRGHLWIDEIIVTAGALVTTGPTAARLALGWRTLSSASAAAVPILRPAEEDPYARLV